ncbi:uncharacterized protein LOC111111107 isoform X2 [Crassostrea virginica]
MRSFCEISCTFLFLCLCVCLSVDCQKKVKPPRWKPKSRPYNGDTIIAKSSGSNIKLSCPAYGSPKPSTQWFKDEAAFDASQRPKTKVRHSSLILNDVQEVDKGNYKCVVENSAGSIDFTFIVDVIRTSWPLVLEEPQNSTVMEGERVAFQCRALNDPDATTQWIRRVSEGELANSGAETNKNFLDSNGPELVIESARVEDTGKYTCMVGNYVGIKSVDVWLMVKQTTTSTSTTTTTTKPPTTTTTTTTPTTTTTTKTIPQPTTTKLAVLDIQTGPLIPNTIDDEDFFEGSGNDLEKEEKKKKNKKNKKKKDRKMKKKLERQRERERKQQQREKKRQEELDRMNKENSMGGHVDHQELPGLTFPNFNNPNQDLSGHIFPPPIETNPPSEDDNDFFTNTGIFNGNKDNEFISNSGYTNNDILTTDKDPFNAFPQGPQPQEEEDMSAWTIYIIVGLVVGAILLVGLVAIVVILCL